MKKNTEKNITKKKKKNLICTKKNFKKKVKKKYKIKPNF